MADDKEQTEVSSFRYDKRTRQKWEELAKWENRTLNNMLVRLIHREHNRQE